MTIKEAAKEILKAHCSSCYTRECKVCAYDTALLAMLHPSDNWTPCSVALPPSNGRYPNDVSDDVFVTGLTNENTRYVEQAYYVHKFKTWESCADEGGTLRTVLAWQPLPEPYRGEA